MSIVTLDQDAIVEALIDHEFFEVDGFRFDLVVESDDLSFEDIEDPGVFGSVEVVHHGEPRPEGFNGSAEKLHLGNNHPMHSDIWYMPPPDFKKFKGSGFPNVEEWKDRKREHKQYVWDVLAWGYTLMVIEVQHVLPNGYQNSWSQAIGGLEPFAKPADYQEVIEDLVYELIIDIQGSV